MWAQVDVFVHVLVADGGLLPACINAAVLALAHAGALPLLPPPPSPLSHTRPHPSWCVRRCKLFCKSFVSPAGTDSFKHARGRLTIA